MTENTISLDDAVELARTGDLLLFRGRSVADHAIRAVTNSPVNHVGMAVVLDDLPPLLWHAELGQSLPDMWTGARHRGAQLHDLRAAVTVWSTRYDQRAWLRQLDLTVTRDMEDELLRVIARMDGTPFPAMVALARRWVRGRARRAASVEATYCAELVAGTYQAMGLLGSDRPGNWYDAGSFWSGDRLELTGGAVLGAEIGIAIDRPRQPRVAPPTHRWREPGIGRRGPQEASEVSLPAPRRRRIRPGPGRGALRRRR